MFCDAMRFIARMENTHTRIVSTSAGGRAAQMPAVTVAQRGFLG